MNKYGREGARRLVLRILVSRSVNVNWFEI